MPEALWFERRFAFDLPDALFGNVVERVRGTPARIEERVRGLSATMLTRQIDGTWSIQENVGHLLDLEPLWLTRAEELRAGAAELTAAELTNRKTWDAGHNARPLETLLAAFRAARARFVALLDAADPALRARSARHPRLQTPMRLIDLTLFVAEHDDHHLTRIGELARAGR